MSWLTNFGREDHPFVAMGLLLAILVFFGLCGCGARTARVNVPTSDAVHVLAIDSLRSDLTTLNLERIALNTPIYEAGYQNPTPGDSHAAAYKELTERLRSWGVSVTEAHFEGAGLANQAERAIVINATLPVNGKLETLAHEGAHLLQSRSVLQQWSVSEVAADMVSHRVLKYYGLDNAKVSGRYLAAFKEGFAAARYLEADIAWAVRVLTGQAPGAGFTRP